MKSQSLSVLGWFLLAPLLPAAEFSTSNSSQFASAMLEESVSVGTNASEYISWMQQQSALGARADMGGDEDAGAAGKRGDSSTSTTPPVTSMRAKEVATGLVYANAAGKLKRTEIAPLWGEGGYIQFFEQSAPIRFSPNLNQSVVVETTKAAGRPPSQSATAGLAYVEENTGRRIIIALPRDSTVQATHDGVFYTNAFDQVDGDVVYKVHPWGLEQFVYLYGDLPDPGDLGLDAETSTLCVLTEIMGLDLAQMGVNRDAGKEPGELSPEPMQVFRESLGGWTEAHHFLRSYAYSGREGIAIGGTQMDATDRQPVGIRLLREGGRIFLSEEIPLAALRSRHPELFRTEPSSRDLSLRLPPPRAGSDETPAMGAPDAIQELAHHYVPRPESHFVMDYIEYTGSNTVDMIFRSGNTYFISAPLILSGSKLTLEPGAVVKFATNAYIQLINGAWVESRSHLLNPAIFTSASDTNRGELIYGGQDPMTSRYVRALILDSGTNDLSGIAIHYAQIGVEINAAGNQRVRDSQIFQSHRGISLSGTSTTGWLFNVLIRDGAEGIYAGSKSAQIAQHTFMGLTNWAVSTGGGIADLEMRQNIFYSIPNAFASNVPLNVATVGANASYDVFTGWMGAAVVSLSSNTFFVGPYGSNYLAQTSPAVDAGSTSASAVGLFHYTTSTNGIKETNSVVDIGFHYATTHDLDGDGLPDFVEDSNGDGSFNAGDYSNLDDSDTDDDGLDDAEEHALGTNPQATDTDGDGISDYAEVAYGTDPLNAASFPATISGQTIYSGSQTGTLHISLTPYAVNTNQPALSLSFDAAHPIYDNSAWQNPLTVNGATWTNSGKYGGAYSFDGNDTITLGKLYQAVGIYNVSWGAWIAAEPGIWLGGVLGKTYFGNDALYMILADSGSSVETRIKPADGGAARDAIKLAMITNGVWQHLFVTYDGTQTKLYLNGGLVATSAVFAAQPVRSNNVDAALGDLSPGAGWYFRGRMDEVQLYRATLTDAEIAGMYRSSLTAEYTRATTQFTTGSYSFAQVPTLSNYWVMAWRDGNGNGIRDYYEPVGFYNGNSFLLTNALTGVDIELRDPDSDGDGASDWLELQAGTDPASSASVPVSISGTIAYSGGQTGPIVVSAEIESGLLLHYDFDTPNTSRVSNVISTLYTGIVNGALYVTNGHTGGAYWYDGINDYILVGPMGVLPEGTISYWVNPDVVENWRNPFTTDYAGWDDCIRFEAYSSGVFLGAGYGLTGQCWYAASMPTATWQHIVLTWNQSNAWGYYNGTFKFHSFHQGQGGTVGLNPSMDNVAIGNGYSTDANRYWKGRIDEVKIYGRTLSSNDVASLYTTGSGTGLLRYTTTIAGPGPYVISNIPNRAGYRLTAWRDSNTNGLQDEAEAWATYSNNPIMLMQNATNANLELVDPDTDLDGMPDWWEILHGFNPNSLAQSQMIAWWPFEESGGLVASNVVSTNYSGTLENMTSSNRVPGMLGQAMWFDGANDFISIGPDLSAAITNTITVDTWVWAESLDEESAWRGIFNEVFPDAGQVEFSLTLHGTSHLASVGYFDGTWRMRQDSAGFQTGRWTRVTGSFDRTNLALYVDGVLRASGPSGSSTLPNGNDGWRIGRRHDFGNPGNMWHGMLDEIRVYSVALSSNAVATMYDALRDADGDGLSNLQEYLANTNPFDPDSDKDHIPDGWEVLNGLNPLAPDSGADLDWDGFSNYEEYLDGTNPQDVNSHMSGVLFVSTNQVANPDGSYQNPYSSLMEAINAATSGMRIHILPGTYRGYLNRNIEFLGKSLRVHGIGPPRSVIIDCERTGRAFRFNSLDKWPSEISNITIINGYDPEYGGGVLMDGGSVRINGCIFEQCTSYYGGALVFREGATGEVINTVVRQNYANSGGGIYIYWSSPTLRYCSILENSSDGIRCSSESSPLILNSILWANARTQLRGGAPMVSNSIIQSWTRGGSVSFNNPQFYALGPDYYQLKDTSPARSIGVFIESELWDINGQIRVDPSDAGAAGYRDDDHDDLPDWWEWKHFGNIAVQDAFGDPDQDQYINLQEYQWGTDPNSSMTDVDGDGLPDEWEFVHFGNLAQTADSDYDNDHVPDLIEYIEQTNPADAADVDDDGLSDDWERWHFGGIEFSDGTADLDGDGLTDLEEYNARSAPNTWDTNGDGISDGDAVNIYGQSPINDDFDDDGMPNSWELMYGLNMTNAADSLIDTDGDGYINIYEYHHGSDPTSLAAVPAATIIVDPNASNPGNGSLLSPFYRLRDAVNKAGPYDIIFIRGGTNLLVDSIIITNKPLMLVADTSFANPAIIGAASSAQLSFASGVDRRTVVRGLRFSGRKAQSDSFISCFEASPVFENCVFWNNESNPRGVLDLVNSSPRIRGCTFAYNQSAAITGDGRSQPVIEGCIIAHNRDGGIRDVDARCFDSIVMHEYVRGENNELRSPDLVGPAFGNLMLLPFSLAIDRVCVVPASASDIRGQERWDNPSVTGCVVDAGAYEYVDTDGDAMDDRWEYLYWSNLLMNATNDADLDGLPNAVEYALGLNPVNSDTSSDGIADGAEDYDGDGLANAAEVLAGTNPRKPDSDGDGFDDGEEIQGGTSPLSASQVPDLTRSNGTLTISEVLYYPAGPYTNYQFVELYNAGQAIADLSDYGLLVVSRFHASLYPLSNAPIDSNAFYLVGGPLVQTVDYQRPDEIVEYDLPVDTLPPNDGAVFLVDLGSYTVLDGLIYGNSIYGLDELMSDYVFDVNDFLPVSPVVPMGSSVARIQKGYKSSTNWIARPLPSPKGSGGASAFGDGDQDSDGLSDELEILIGSDVNSADTDMDGLSDYVEFYETHTSVINDDSDGDGPLDSDEILWGTNPFSPDTDGDGIDDAYEVELGLDPLDGSDAGRDDDNDGYSNLEELGAGADWQDGSSTPYTVAVAQRAAWGAPDNFEHEDDPAYGSLSWSHPFRTWDVCPSGTASGYPALFDKTRRYTRNGVCRLGFERDFHREWVFNFSSYKENIPAYVKIHRKPRSHHFYRVGGANLLHTARRNEVYGSLRPQSIRVDETFIKTKKGYIPPRLDVMGPFFLNIVANDVWPQHEEVLGMVVPLNDNHDNGNPDIADYDAPYISAGDPDLIPIRVQTVPGVPHRYSCSPEGIVRLYENPTKMLAGGTFSALQGAIQAATPYRGYNNELLYVEGISPGVTYLTVYDEADNSLKDRIKITILKVDSVEAYCDKFGASGSFGVNPEIFPGGEWDFGQPDQPPPYWWLPGTYANPSSQVLKVFFKYIKDANDEPAPFNIDLKANILPDSIPDDQLNITWINWAGPSASGSFDKTDEREVKFQNPTKGGLYKFRMEMEIQPYHIMASDAWVLLPKAGGEIADWIVTEVPSLVTRAADWETAVRAVAVTNGLNEDEFLETAWIAIATYDFDYQGIVGSPTKRYSFRDGDRPIGHLPDPGIPGMVGEKGNGDWDEPSYATLRGIVVHRAKVNNAMYAVWGRKLGYTTFDLRSGAFWNAASRGLWDDSTSQNAIILGGDLYNAHSSGSSLSAVLTKSRAKAIQSPDTPTGLNDVNLWPDPTPVSSGFVLPTMPRDYDSLIVGTNETVRGRLFN